MTAPVTVPQVPPLANLHDIELIHTGQWDISTGTWTVTTDDIVGAVAALDCPAVRRPVLKLGHVDPRFDGEPAIGWVDNLAATDGGHTLRGDFVGMPGWLGEVAASAYPDRSIEGFHDFVCQIGHTHPFVLTAVALLGVSAPGIGTLQSLQDVAQLYGVAAEPPCLPNTVVTAAIAAKRGPMPNPSPRQVAAGVTTEDVRRAYYDDAPWSVWIEEFHLDPLQLIVIDDNTGKRSRVPVVVGEGDGEDAVSFGDAVPVVIRYEDAPADNGVAASVGRIRFASRAESRPGTQSPASASAGGSTQQEGSPAVAFTDEQLTTMRQTLSLEDDADETAILAAMSERLVAPTDPTPAPLPEGVVTIDSTQLEALQVAARRGEQARTRQEQEDREALVAAAISDGRIPPARREHWLSLLSADAGTADVLASLKPGTVPVGEPIGHSAESDPASSDNYWFPGTATTSREG